MPNFETPDELADHLADLLGIYEDKRCAGEAHVDDCNCRLGWVPMMAARIRSAVAVEKFLYPMTERALTSGADVSPPRRAEATRALPARDWSSEKEADIED